ncbi:hypothetical protein KNSL1_012391, partial [Colletotrichum chrysophilum]
MASDILDFAAPNELNSAQTKVLFHIVDKTLPFGLSKIANLPEIIVVGDRSSGKSSLSHTAASAHPPENKGSMMDLVESYMKKPNSIVLAVVSAENELESQSIMQEAAKYDPSRQRSPEENEYLKIARSHEAASNLGLGWHVLCNRKDDEDLDPREFVEEEFFESGL